MTASALRTLCVAFPLVATLPGAALAQQFNIDFDTPTPTTPASTYAAAGTAGVWNSIPGAVGGLSLVDKSGAATSVVLNFSGPMNWFEAINPSYSGDDAKLLNDCVWEQPGPALITISGLANGDYTVLTYALAPDNNTFITGVDVSGSTGGVQNVGGTLWPGSHVQGVSYARHDATVIGGSLVITVTEVLTYMSLNGIQIEQTASNPGTAYCFGDGTGANCPCSGFGGLGAGCANTSGAGAVLTGSGSASFILDSFQLDITGVPGDKPGLVLKGDSQVAIPAGDGILCNTGGSMRSHVQVTSMGATTFTDFSGSPFGSVSNAGGVPTNFQFWYRDPANTCSGAGFNFTNGWTVTYLP